MHLWTLHSDRERERERECTERQIKEIRAITLNPTRINNTRYFYLFRHCTALWTRARPSTRSNYRHNTRLWGSLVSFKQQGPQCCAQAKPPVQAPMKTMMLILFASFIEGPVLAVKLPKVPSQCVCCVWTSHMLLLIKYVYRIKRTEHKRPQGMTQSHSKFIAGSVYTLPFWLKYPNWRETFFP